ncbi:DNA binding,DNA-directed RNA polymerase [Artemisia annua]|uniref:DNA binding,DNA-directed RNA polymerase n=1 Tax=Artemisia annua TaxID=35608 RepID=A0A2U1KKV5_ARTAN|nr:DNA binding,DNA-directed RNA polymerase [Artemisia annua]
MGKKHKHDTTPTQQPDMEQQQQPQSSKRKKTKPINVKIETLNPTPDKSLPIIGYFSSGYDPHNKKRKTEVKVMKHVKRSNRMQVVVSCNNGDNDNDDDNEVKFVGTNYSGEAAAQQVCSYSLGVLDKETGLLKILPIECNKIFRLEPRFGDEVDPADEISKVDEAEEKKEKTFQFSTKKSEQTAKKEKALRANRDPDAQADLNSKMADAKVNAKALEVSAATTSSARNIPPHDLSATIPQQAYPLEKIILKGEWRYLLDIAEILQEGKSITPESYPVFVCNRIHKIDEVKDEEAKESLACIYSYINHLIKFKDKHSMDGFSSAKHHKLPNILTQKFNDMFANAESKRLADDKRDLLISYVLVLTLFVDNFKTEFSDIAKDLRMSTGALRPHFEFLGCKFTRENNITLATLPAPLKFPEVRVRRRR